MKKIKEKIAELEKKLAISYEEYKKEHPKTKKTKSDPMFQGHNKKMTFNDDSNVYSLKKWFSKGFNEGFGDGKFHFMGEPKKNPSDGSLEVAIDLGGSSKIRALNSLKKEVGNNYEVSYDNQKIKITKK